MRQSSIPTAIRGDYALLAGGFVTRLVGETPSSSYRQKTLLKDTTPTNGTNDRPTLLLAQPTRGRRAKKKGKEEEVEYFLKYLWHFKHFDHLGRHRTSL